MEKKFSGVAVSGPEHPHWEELTARRNPMYRRPDDIRSPFARDYTRVLHSLAYRRLKHKTQVFYNAAGNDHICTRIEHVAHVESVSSTIAKALGLNDELTKAIAFAHDLGHAPFGHQGEKVIDRLTREHLNEDFWHEKNGLYFVDRIELLEDNEKCLRNLNLTFAVRDGIVSHCGELDQNTFCPRQELFDPEEFRFPGQYEAATWEGCVVKLADKISYLGRDIEDAMRLKILTQEQIRELQVLANVHDEKAVNTTVIMHNMATNLCQNSSPEEGLRLSGEMSQLLNDIKEFNMRCIYRNERLDAFGAYSELVIRTLFDCLMRYYRGADTMIYLRSIDFDRYGFVKAFEEMLAKYTTFDFTLPSLKEEREVKAKCKNEKIYGALETEKIYARAVIDFIAGMTDMYAINSFNELLGC